MSFKSITPLHDKVLIKPLEQGEQRKGAILIADMGEEKTKFGKVVAVGPGRTSEFGSFVSVSAKVGDVVIVPKIGAQRVEIGEEEYWLIADRDIVATADYVAE